jgi:hypothetical protein
MALPGGAANCGDSSAHSPTDPAEELQKAKCLADQQQTATETGQFPVIGLFLLGSPNEFPRHGEALSSWRRVIRFDTPSANLAIAVLSGALRHFPEIAARVVLVEVFDLLTRYG